MDSIAEKPITKDRQHVIKINNRLHEIRNISHGVITVNTGKQFARYYPAAGKMVVKHVLSGQFKSIKMR